MYCSKCGKEIKDGSKFCPFCGAEVKGGDSIPKRVENQAVQQQNVVPNYNTSYGIASNQVVLKHSVSGLTKSVPIGFSWTMLFFGGFVPLFRGDFKWFAITLITSIITSGVGWVVWPFFYNKLYIKDLLTKGFIPADENSKNILLSRGLIVK